MIDSVAASDFHLFGPLKTHLSGRHFTNDVEVECEVKIWFKKRAHSSMQQVGKTDKTVG
jgi:hypothetical protein